MSHHMRGRLLACAELFRRITLRVTADCRIPRARRGNKLTRLLVLLLLASSAIVPALARANECPTFNETVSPLGSVTFNITCSPTGAESVTNGQYGTVTSSGESDTLTYTNTKTSPTNTDQFTFVDDKSETITVDITIGTPTYPPITLSPSPPLPSGSVGTTYTTQTFTASGGNGGPYTYNIVSGNLPNGLNFSGNTISGTPTESGSFSIEVTASDTAGNVSNPVTYSLLINGGVLSVSPSAAPAGNLYALYSLTMSTTGGTPPYTYTYGNTGSLPPGISFNAGTFSGTPSQTGTFTYAVNVADNAGNSERVDYTFVINPPDITISPTTLPAGTQYTAYSQALGASGGDPSGSYTFQLSSGTLPTGLTLSSAGVLSGTTSASGTYTFYVVATDSSPGPAGPYSSSPQKYTLTINANLPTITTTSLPNGTVDVGYSEQITASNGEAPYQFSATSLPAGMQISASGLITGTPTASGNNFSPTVTVTDHVGNTGSQTFAMTILAPTIAISPSSLTNPALHVAYSQTIAASGGTSPYTYAPLNAAALPPGLTLSSGGVLSGTPTTNGSYTFSVTATDSTTGQGPYSKTANYTVTVSAPDIVVSPSSLSNPQVGVPYSVTFGASGGSGSYTYAASGTLPPGLTLNAGVLSGTATAGGSYNFTITATDSNTNTGSASYPVTVSNASITLSPSTLNAMTAGAAFSQTLSASGGTPNYQYSVLTGTLPAGLSLNSNTGAISGTPTVEGPYNFTIQARDSSTGSGPYTGSLLYSGNIAAPNIVISPSGNTLNANYAQAYSQTFAASGGTAPYTYSMSGVSIPGLSWNAATATLSGTPTQPGNYSITITATDHTGGTGPTSFSQSYTLTVGTASISIAPLSLSNGSVGTAYPSTTLSASGGIAPYTYALAAGSSMPPGLTLSSSGTISGTPTSANSFTFSVVATDHDGATGTQTYSNVLIGAATITLTPSSPALPVAIAETAYSGPFSSSGGTAPYHYAITAGALPPGLTLSSTGVLSGTPTASGNYSVTIRSTDSSTGTGAPFFTSIAYTLTVNAPSITISPSTLAGAQVAAAYSQQLTASGGDGSYTFNVSAGSLPTGLSLSTSGLLSGTATAAGNYSFTVTAKDSLNFTGSQAYTINTLQPKPVTVNDTASTPANQAVTINVTSVDTGPITSIALGTPPTHGTAVVNGLAIVYTPTHDFYGTDTLTYTATGPGGTSAAATVTITVAPLAVPTVIAQNVTVLAGNNISINPTTGATGGPFTAVNIVKAPSSGTATVSGSTINYSTEVSASGQVAFTYTLSNAFGASQPATVTVTVNPRPMIAPQNISSIAGRSAQVNLTQGANGGPFTAATLVSLSPSSAGNARIVPISGGYQLDFTSSPTFSGAAVVTYTLSNMYATSAPGTVTITVAARPDPSKDPEVLGVLNAQADAAREFAQGQIGNFQQRLESLHGGGGDASGGFQNNLTFMSGDSNNAALSPQWLNNNSQNTPGNLNRRYMVDPQTPANPTTTSSSTLPDGYVLWSGGAVNFGSRDTTATANGFDFTTAGVSIGLDRRFSSSFATGVGIGYGHDDTDIGHNGSDDTADSYNVAWYASFSPSPSTFIDGLIGYQWLSFDSRRYVTADSNTVNGNRDGHQTFASVSAGYEYRSDTWLISPYGRLDVASARLDQYTEQGDAIYALSYGNELVKTTTASLGLRMNYVIKEDYGSVMPQLRIEYGHDFQGSSQATMTYADLLAGPIYRAQVDQLTQNHFMIGIGLNWELARQLTLRLEYENEINAGDQNDQSVLFNVQKKF
ncbi:putative Ig domain-containing protein [Dyella caseinilytica]|uniref:Ig domain-containing protein n=1 Tax=Dyella caseinilytica TaxID=1849581 RepID=A0ABX7GWV7_9GAMM|nr:putative Ig domain-containing protein [Dyella caseinilytica]QRN53690.1 putative Ig domain-containing protein [Dyella caseinilytica]GFZ88536.1 hemagglutinin [Dyella caseinilytica]